MNTPESRKRLRFGDRVEQGVGEGLREAKGIRTFKFVGEHLREADEKAVGLEMD